MIYIWIITFVWILFQLLYQELDFVQLDKRGRSGTRQDYRKWIITSFMNTTDEHASKMDVGRVLNVMDNQ